MGKYTLTQEQDYNDSKSKVVHEFEAEKLHDVLMYLEAFLRGCGYYFDGELTIVDDEDSKSSSLKVPKLLLED